MLALPGVSPGLAFGLPTRPFRRLLHSVRRRLDLALLALEASLLKLLGTAELRPARTFTSHLHTAPDRTLSGKKY
ncbi:hypothetical protein FRAAL3324 [Frankia alni ACN14a]|uniref:Uncharacterized protein n=1 Tax=Frankia alni (strain DSM 45986 / CECT 9034 / ACN14a) TaxID=326424 RepID=Q0RKJ0_FRAAA|nr:hypothetical protein FRAAL3324 [Frankia alni ACN14a]